MVCELEFVVVAIRRAQLDAVIIVVDHGSIMLLVDIPVDAEHVLLVCLRTVSRQATRIVVIEILGDAFDAIVVFFAEPWTLYTVA